MDWDGKTWSYSRVNAYLQCPMSWAFKYHPKYHVKKPRSEFLAMGVAVHDAMEYINKLRIEGTPFGDIEVDKLRNVLINSFTEQRMDSMSVDFDIATENELVATSLSMIAGYLGRYGGTDDDIIPVHSEYHMTTEVDKDIILQGYIDGIIGDNKILDYKTAGKRWMVGREFKELQPAFYSLLMGKDIEFVFDIMLKHKKIDFDSFDRRFVRVGVNGRDKAKNLIKLVADAVKKEVFVPALGSNTCNYCDYAEECNALICKCPDGDVNELLKAVGKDVER